MAAIFDWPFLQEPIWRWFLFLIVLTCFFAAWGFVLSHIKVGG